MDHRSSLNDDVWMEILSHLPVQSLLRFKTVCKSWCNMINSSTFKQLHVQNYSYNNNDNIFLQFDRGDNFVWKLSAIFPNRWRHTRAFPDSFQALFNTHIKFSRLRILGPVNGLICIYEKGSFGTVIAICNPVLGEIKILPVPTTFSPKSYAKRREIGFGFDSATKEYKVVQLQSGHTVRVYSSKTNTWRDLDTETLNRNLIIRKAIETPYKNGALALWLVVDGGGCFRNLILSFDMHDEVFKEISPYYYTSNMKCKVFTEDETIVLFKKSTWEKYSWERYELKAEENQMRWRKMRTIRPLYEVTPVALRKRPDQCVVLKRRNYAGKDQILFYDCGSRNIKRDIEVPENVKQFKIVEYKGSLISP